MFDDTVIDAIRRHAITLADLDSVPGVIDAIGDARIVLLGEASHGTHEFYRTRIAITKELIEQKGFAAVAVEADWPDALRVNDYVRQDGDGSDGSDGAANAEEIRNTALGGFERFPRWMWRNADMLELVQWLRQWNSGIASGADKIGFYGLDVYSLRRSMDAVVQYLDKVDPEAAKRARTRYACFDHLAEDPEQYAYETAFGMRKDCEIEVSRQLVGMMANAERYAGLGNHDAIDQAFYAEQNARVAQNAEAYFRTMFVGGSESWNVRDTHMADTLDALLAHLEKRRGVPAKIVVWAHNSHIGDARATEVGRDGELNLGQLVRERHGNASTFLLGFTTHTGTVTAASDWDRPAESKAVLPSRPDSYERLFHDAGLGTFLLPLRHDQALADPLHAWRLQRAIGVVYLPESERMSHYFHTDLASQFDAVIHFDETSAVQPLDRLDGTTQDVMPETYPSGM